MLLLLTRVKLVGKGSIVPGTLPGEKEEEEEELVLSSW
jgi:hypothetical protein